MENGGSLIDSVTLYACGYCENKLQHVLRGEKKKSLKFPALVVKIKHSTKGTILFDTGYSKRVYENGVISKIYNTINPTTVAVEDTIAYKLREEGEKVAAIILSHPHPDHIGCLRDFPDSKLYLTKGCFRKMKNSRLLDLVFQNQLPDVVEGTILKPYKGSHFLKYYFNEIYDILGDGSILGVALDGHSKGQMGIYLPRYQVLFAADASWGKYFAKKVHNMRAIPRIIQNDFSGYADSINKITTLQRKHPEIRVIYSHEAVKDGSVLG